MRQRQRFFTVFILFFFFSLIAIALFRTQVGFALQGIIEVITAPIQSVIHTSFITNSSQYTSKQIKTLREENEKLLKELAKQKETEKENQALKDQFALQTLPPKKLLPANIIGSRSSDVGAVEPEEIVIDKGSTQGVSVGEAVVYKDILVGKVVRVSNNRSAVRIPISKESTIPARTAKTGAIGIVKGGAENVIFDNVLLSDSIISKDIVVTKGDMDEKGIGLPPGLIIGKVTAIHKRASALFQAAEIEPVLSVNRLSTVFVYLSEN